jgi:hypothetical protein
MIGNRRTVELYMSEALYTRSALLETIERYELFRKETVEKFGERMCDVIDLALREMRSALRSLEERFPEIKKD